MVQSIEESVIWTEQIQHLIAFMCKTSVRLAEDIEADA